MKCKPVEKVFPLNSNAHVTLSGDTGAFVCVGSNREDIIIRYNEPEREDLLEEFNDCMEINVDAEGDSFSLEVNGLDFGNNSYHNNDLWKFEILLPHNAVLDAEMELGSISVEGMNRCITIKNENGPLRSSHCSGDLEIQNENGPIKIEDCQGTFNIQQENGSIAIKDSEGTINCQSENGSIKMLNVLFSDAEIINENGTIIYESLPQQTGNLRIKDENGSIKLVIPDCSQLDLYAQAENGSITIKAPIEVSRTIKNDLTTVTSVTGEGTLVLNAENENGSILLTQDVSAGLDGIHVVFDSFDRFMTGDAETIAENVKQKLSQIENSIPGLQKILDSSHLDKIKESLEGAIHNISDSALKFQNSVQGENGFDKDKFKGEIKQTVDDVKKTIKESIQQLKNSGKLKNVQVDISKLGQRFDKWTAAPTPPAPPSGPNHSAEIDKAARMKILEMLDQGKINAEEAERLLAAISK